MASSKFNVILCLNMILFFKKSRFIDYLDKNSFHITTCLIYVFHCPFIFRSTSNVRSTPPFCVRIRRTTVKVLLFI